MITKFFQNSANIIGQKYLKFVQLSKTFLPITVFKIIASVSWKKATIFNALGLLYRIATGD